jgi:ABC-2 type transport system permease protein
MQAMQLSFFTILPSGFMFHFAGAGPSSSARGIPATHFLRIVRKVMLKSAGVGDIGNELMALGVIAAVIVGLAMVRYRRTLD